MKHRKENGLVTDAEILDMARSLCEAEPAYIIGRQLIESVCLDTGLDNESAAAMLMDGGGMPRGVAAISARAANDLIRLAEAGELEGDVDTYLGDERFAKMLLEMPVKAALRLYAAECRMEETAKREREIGAKDIMEKIAARRALPIPIRGDVPAEAQTDYANMPSDQFRRIKERLMQAAAQGRRVIL